ncbi:MAG: hypothetical protein IJS80_07915 [Lachnospiraceae bacterium]|nr:hypothetical protein [Lachnospiraceae bacterium]
MAKYVANKQNKDLPIVSVIVIFFMTLFTLLLGKKYLGVDFSPVMKWWFAMFAAGVAFFPLAHAAFNRFSDGGYMIAKALGIEVGSWFIWTLATARIMKFNHTNTWICLAVCAVLNYGLYAFRCYKKQKTPFGELDSKKIIRILYYEVLFLAVFFFFCYFKSFRVTITNDTEKYMDFGFLASLMNTDYMPAGDMWFSGEPINYYYYGIYVAAYLGKLSGLSAGYAYNLDLMMICSLGFVQVYAIVAELLKWGVEEHDRRKKLKDTSFMGTKTSLAEFCAHIGGTVGGLAVFIAGNMHYVLYACIYPFMERVMGLEEQFYWFPSSTRFITDSKTGDGTLIHEFPSYSFVLGDLHAHVTDITNVMLILSVLLGFLLNRAARMKAARENGTFEKVSKNYLIKEAIDPAIVIASFLIGIIRMTNSWDFPIYFVVSGAILCFSNAVITGFNKDTLILTAMHAVECLVISTLISLPFTLFFDSMTAGINVCYYHSNPYELAVLWALPVSVSIGLYVISINRYKQEAGITEESKSKKGKIKKDDSVKPGFLYKTEKNVNSDGTVTKSRGGINHLYSFINRLETSDLFVLTLAVCAAGLVLMCELIYVKDIYGGSYSRTNTMFKLAYQAFMMFGIVMSYGTARLIFFWETKKQRNLAIVALVFILWTFGYFGNATVNYVGNISDSDKAGRTLDSYNTIVQGEMGVNYINGVFCKESEERTKVLDDMIKWVMENTEVDSVIAQMPTTAYKPFATISAFTGRPAVIGWANHEWLWRNGGTLEYPQIVAERVEAMKRLYSTDSEAEAREIIEKYDIDYIYVGYTETLVGNDVVDGDGNDVYNRYYRGTWYKTVNVNNELLKSLGTVVYDGGKCEFAMYPTKWSAEIDDWTADTSRDPLYKTDFETYIVKVNR